MSKFSLIKTTEFRPDGEVEQYGLSIGGQDLVEMTADELDQLRKAIEEVLNVTK